MTVEVIPYKNFKERLQLINKLKKEQRKIFKKLKIILTIEIFNNYLYIERTPWGYDGRMQE